MSPFVERVRFLRAWTLTGRGGYDLELTAAVSAAVDIPVIASGGAGEFKTISPRSWPRGNADAVRGQYLPFRNPSIAQAKHFLAERGIPVRL